MQTLKVSKKCRIVPEFFADSTVPPQRREPVEREDMTPTVASNRAVKDFVARWEELPCVEEEHSRSFWIEFVEQVLCIPNATRILEFERKFSD